MLRCCCLLPLLFVCLVLFVYLSLYTLQRQLALWGLSACMLLLLLFAVSFCCLLLLSCLSSCPITNNCCYKDKGDRSTNIRTKETAELLRRRRQKHINILLKIRSTCNKEQRKKQIKVEGLQRRQSKSS